MGGGWAGLAESGWAGRSAVITGHLSGQLGVTRGRGVVSTGSGVDGVIHTPEGEGGGGVQLRCWSGRGGIFPSAFLEFHLCAVWGTGSSFPLT